MVFPPSPLSSPLPLLYPPPSPPPLPFPLPLSSPFSPPPLPLPLSSSPPPPDHINLDVRIIQRYIPTIVRNKTFLMKGPDRFE